MKIDQKLMELEDYSFTRIHVFGDYGMEPKKIDNMCAASAITSCESTENLVVPILIEHGKKLYDYSKEIRLLESGIICQNGKFVHSELIRHMVMYEKEAGRVLCQIKQEN